MTTEWISVKDQVPPYDVLVLCRGTKSFHDEKNDKTYNYHLYALAVNQVYKPEICMVQVIEGASFVDGYKDLPFELEHWMHIPGERLLP